jgi:hypothetical protein
MDSNLPAKRAFLVLDCTPFDERMTIVYLGLLIHSRVLPLAWRVMPAQQQWPERQWEIVKSLLDQVAPHLEHSDCTLLADRGLVGWPLVQLCRAQHWHYLLCVRREHTSRRWMGRWTAWRPLGQLRDLALPAVVRACAALAGADTGDSSERRLGACLSRGLVAHLGSPGRSPADQRVRRAHARGGDLSRQQKPRLEPRGQSYHRPLPPGSAPARAVSRAVVGDPFGGVPASRPPTPL